MTKRYTLGIEEEFQLVKTSTGELASRAQGILEKGLLIFEEQLKPEMLQSTLEFVTPILNDISTARQELYTARALLAQLVQEEGLALVSAGTHPTSLWQKQRRSTGERYTELEQEYQDLGRMLLIFGLHVHVAIPTKEAGIYIMNVVRSWLPQILALSSNSPFWSDRMTGIKSYRSVVWRSFPRSGIPDIYPSWNHFDQYVQSLINAGCIDNGKKIWWDIRPHPFFNTLEFRICDMPATLEDTLALAALCQALVAKIDHLYEQGKELPVLTRDHIDENKWRAMRYGLDAEFIDFTGQQQISMRKAIAETLDFVDDVVDELGSRRETNYIRSLLEDSQGTGADRQIALYRECGNAQQITQFLIEQTMTGIKPGDARLSEKYLRFRPLEVV